MPERAQPSLIDRTIDYIFGRNALIGVASFMLLIISGYATWHGMRRPDAAADGAQRSARRSKHNW